MFLLVSNEFYDFYTGISTQKVQVDSPINTVWLCHLQRHSRSSALILPWVPLRRRLVIWSCCFLFKGVITSGKCVIVFISSFLYMFILQYLNHLQYVYLCVLLVRWMEIQMHPAHATLQRHMVRVSCSLFSRARIFRLLSLKFGIPKAQHIWCCFWVVIHVAVEYCWAYIQGYQTSGIYIQVSNVFFYSTCRFHFSLHQSIQSNQSGNVFVSWTQVGYWRQALPMLTRMMQAWDEVLLER